MVDAGVDMELDTHFARDIDCFDSDCVWSTDGKPGGNSDTHGTPQASNAALDNVDKLSDRHVLEAVNKLLKVRTSFGNPAV